jgi:hypothetical protein
VAVDGGGTALISTDPTDPSPTWSSSNAGDILVSVSCPSRSFCAAAGLFGNVSVTTDPTDPSPTWSAAQNVGGLPHLEQADRY